MKYFQYCVGILFFYSSLSSAEYNSSDNLKISQVSSLHSNGQILVQTDPRPDISGLGSTENYWLILPESEVAFKIMPAFVLSAYATGKTVSIEADDGISGSFCRLRRIILK